MPSSLADEGIDPEAELRARLILYRAFRDAGVRLLEDALRPGRAVPPRARRSRAPPALAGRPTARRGAALAARSSWRRWTGSPGSRRRRRPRPRSCRGRSRSAERAAIIRRALDGAPAVVLQELLSGVRDRVVVAVTFLAMLELMKRREIVVEQAEPCGPIVARRTTAEERAAAGITGAIEEVPLDESLESFA